jgi:enolase
MFRPETDKVPKLMLTILNGGKELGSKVKFTKFYLIFDVKPQETDQFDIHEVYLKLCEAIIKSVSATKAGIGAFKRSPDGSLYNAYDNINDSFKLLEEAISSVGINTDERKYLKIGVNTDAQSWFVEDAGKYEWDGPKNQMDSD